LRIWEGRMRNLQLKKHSVLGFVILAMLLRPTCLWSQENTSDLRPELRTSLDRDSAVVGSVVELTLSYELPEKARLPEDAEIRGLESIGIVERVEKPGEIRIKLLVDRLGSWKSGILRLAYLDEEEKGHFLEADPVSLTVLSNLGDNPAKAQLRPLQTILPTQPGWLRYLPWGAGLLILLLASLGFFWWRHKSRARADIVEREEPPHIRAQRELEQLVAQNLFETARYKEFYFRFTGILKRYLESLRDYPAAEFTTEEIARHIDDEQDRRILPLLQEADLVKFADTIPTPARKDEDVKALLAYIQETSTIPAEVEPLKVDWEESR